jgi:glycosyltransferase involved in cell wall biosynthesis
MQILMLCYEFPPLGGGGSRVVDGLSRELVRNGHRVDIVTMGFRGLPRHEVVHGVNVHRVPCVRLKEHHCTIPEAATYVMAALPRIRRLVAGHDYGINHTHFILPDGLNAAWVKRATGLPYIITAHGSDVPGYNPHRVRLTHRLLAPVWRRVTRDASCIVCPSRSIGELVARRDPDLETTQIPYGFEIGRYDAEAPRRRQILVVTRMLRRKGVQYLLHAIDRIRLDHEVHIVGDGPYLPELKKQAAGCSSKVVFHGWLDNRSDELNALYESSDIFVLTSEAENFPVSLMEAMAAGLAVVTTRATGCAEVVADTGVLVEPRDAAQLREALVALTQNPSHCRELGRAARRRLETEFAWPVIARRYEELYRTHCRGAGREAPR